MMEICKKTLQSHPQIGVIENAPMADYTSFRIGGPAELLLTPETEEALLFCLQVLKDRKVPYTLLGAGSNMLVSDKGIPGAVIRFAKPFARMRIQGSSVTAEAGITLASLSAACQRAGLSGLETLSGIPGSLGGALCMNAGAYGGEIKNVVTSVRAMNADGELCTIDRCDCCFGYRTSIFSRVGFIALSAKLQ
ncbi:MAG: FAD-binding protein, partial [Clostridia bacterium]|nr:FAD-binding protein [Clostridia bacterium]